MGGAGEAEPGAALCGRACCRYGWRFHATVCAALAAAATAGCWRSDLSRFECQPEHREVTVVEDARSLKAASRPRAQARAPA
jgi:hypothetical protein